MMLMTAVYSHDCKADYKQLLLQGTTRSELQGLYEIYEAEVLKGTGGKGSQVLEKLAGGKDLRQSFLLACLSNGWLVRAVDLDRTNLPPSGVWAYTEEDYRGIVRQFPSDCKDMHCMEISSLGEFSAKSLLLGSSVQATLYSKDGFGGTTVQIQDSCSTFDIQPHSLRIHHPPRIDYVTISDYQAKQGRASFRLHVSGANMDDGSTLVINQAKVDSEIEVRLDNSRWLELGQDTAEAGYNLDPTFYAYPVFHYDSITTSQENILFGQTILIEVHNSGGQVSKTLTYVVPSPDKLDSDGDGLLDAWEVGSVDGLNLVELGANPFRKDVYVEVDRMVVPGRIWSDFSEQDYPSEKTFEESIRAYRSAPIINPDRSVGIALHIDYGQEKFEKAAKSEGGTEIPWKRFLGYKRSASFRSKHPDYYDAEELRKDPAFFLPERSRVFRYCVFGDQQWSSRSTGGGNFKSTFFITLGVCRMNAVNSSYQTGVFLHELGHMFGLSHHGNGKPYNYKPNFNSIMNYKFVFEGRDVDGKLGDGIRGEGSGENVYSYSEGMRASLNEGALREVLGVANHYPHDWDGNGIIDNEPIAKIISKHSRTKSPRKLDDFADWANMRFKQLEDSRVIDRKSPKRLIQPKIPGIARVPRGVEIGFICEVDGLIQTGHWKMVGMVTKHKPGKLTFKTDEFRVRGKIRTEAKTGHLAYKLPEDMPMPISVGDPITILHDYSAKQKRLERNIHISSGNQLILATSRFDDAFVPRSADRAELLIDTLPDGSVRFYWSDPADDDREQALKEVPRISPAVLIQYQVDSHIGFFARAKKGFQSIMLGQEEYLFRILDDEAKQGAVDHQLSANASGSDASGSSPKTISDALGVEVHPGGECLLIRRPEIKMTESDPR